MSARLTPTELLREAAAGLRARSERSAGFESTSCMCEEPVETWFDRSICPEPCNMMHTICCECGYPIGGCLVAVDDHTEAARQRANDAAVADLLDNEANLIDSVEAWPDLHQPLNPARVDLLLAVARVVLGVEDD